MEYEMKYQMFIEMIIRNIRAYLPDSLKDAEIVHLKVDKINCKKDCLAIIEKKKEGLNLSPNLYLESFYKRYEEGWNLQEILESIGRALQNVDKEMGDINEKIQVDTIRENVFFKLINTEQNKELLKTMPPRKFQDLSIIYAWYVGEQNGNLLTAPINHDLAKVKELSEEELYRLAKENTRRLFPTTIRPMQTVIEELMGGKATKGSELYEFEPDEEYPMYVVSNRSGCFGATAVLNEDGMQMLADRLNDNLYLLPSSIHEWIIVPENFTTLEYLSQCVNEVNFSQVELDERLSNNNEIYLEENQPIKYKGRK